MRENPFLCRVHLEIDQTRGNEIGYYVSNGKANWYMKLERYSSSTVFVKNAESLTTNFQDAQKKIEELKVVYKK